MNSCRTSIPRKRRDTQTNKQKKEGKDTSERRSRIEEDKRQAEMAQLAARSRPSNLVIFVTLGKEIIRVKHK